MHMQIAFTCPCPSLSPIPCLLSALSSFLLPSPSFSLFPSLSCSRSSSLLFPPAAHLAMHIVCHRLHSVGERLWVWHQPPIAPARRGPALNEKRSEETMRRGRGGMRKGEQPGGSLSLSFLFIHFPTHIINVHILVTQLVKAQRHHLVRHLHHMLCRDSIATKVIPARSGKKK